MHSAPEEKQLVGSGENRPRVAVVQLPGVNCEPESVRALTDAGLEADVVRWTAADVAGYDAFLLPGGFSFQDRVRGGAIAAFEPILDGVAAAAAAGKPVLGICNGAQVLVEAGLVPALEPGEIDCALAPNTMPGGSRYYCGWTHLAVERRDTIATCAVPAGAVVPMPVAHAEGRFVPSPRLQAAGAHVAWRYCTEAGTPGAFPWNPNGSWRDAAALANAQGHVVAMMPHPERAARLHHVAPEVAGEWGDRRRQAADTSALAGAGPGRLVFRSMKEWLVG